MALPEPIYSIWNYYDCPREGIAGFEGKPHVFKCQFSETDDDWTNRFWLMEIDQQLFALEQERWKIFCRWSQAFRLGKASIDSHPALPEDRFRYTELQDIIGDRLKLRPARAVTRCARFVGQNRVEWSEPPP